MMQRRVGMFHFFISPEYKNEFSPTPSITACCTAFNVAATSQAAG
jgi:hypothetical protein